MRCPRAIYRQTVSEFQDREVTFNMAGNATLGPLHEKSATLGESTQSPTTLFAGDIFTTGELPAKTKSTGNTSHFQVEGYQSDRMLLTVDDELTLPGLDNVADQDSVSELVVHQHADLSRLVRTYFARCPIDCCCTAHRSCPSPSPGRARQGHRSPLCSKASPPPPAAKSTGRPCR